MHAFEGVVILDINFTLIGAQALRLGGEIFALLVDFIFAEFVYIHRLIFLIIGVTFYHVKVELRFGFGQFVSFLWKPAQQLGFGACAQLAQLSFLYDAFG